MAKRKRELVKTISSEQSKDSQDIPDGANGSGPALNTGTQPSVSTNERAPITIQIITGSYERVLHGVTAVLHTLTPITSSTEASNDSEVPLTTFSDTFLFTAHTSSIRCLALSPCSLPSATQPSSKIILASGGTDERINLYHLSASPPMPIKPTSASATAPSLPTISSLAAIGAPPTRQNPLNRELGALIHHASPITYLSFPTRSKLISASEDNTIAITRTRDWTLLSTIKPPNPVAVGRPSGDTAESGLKGVNGVAVHPSGKVGLSVGRGERCLRLWNLVTGKKAGVLAFDKRTLRGVGEGRWGGGEGRVVRFSGTGEEFCVQFERGAIIFGLDSKPRVALVPTPRTKVHQVHYLPSRPSTGSMNGDEQEDSETANNKHEKSSEDSILATSTEDGRVLFYSTKLADASFEDTQINGKPSPAPHAKTGEAALPKALLVGTIRVPDQGRVKDFELLPIPDSSSQTASASSEMQSEMLVIVATSAGAISIFQLSIGDLSSKQPGDVGRLLGTYQTGERITCLKAFVMLPSSPGGEAETESGDTHLEAEGQEEWKGIADEDDDS